MKTAGRQSRARRRWVPAVWAVTVALGCASGYAVATSALFPQAPPVSQDNAASIAVVDGTVGQTDPVSVIATWSTTAEIRAPATGVITTVNVGKGDLVEENHPLFTLNLAPSVVAQGSIPAFRDLQQGDKGDDVAQLQEFLRRAGASALSADGTYGNATVAAVKSWQRARGVEVTGRVSRTDVIFVPQLPVRLTWEEASFVGKDVTQGDTLMTAAFGTPTFEAVTVASQTQRLVQGDIVDIAFGDHRWQGQVAGATPDPATGDMHYALAGTTGDPVCGADCSSIPVGATGTVALDGSITRVPQTTGPMVPQAALSTAADGTVSVTDVTGARVPVEVVAASQGFAIVDGVAVGTKVRLAQGHSDAR